MSKTEKMSDQDQISLYDEALCSVKAVLRAIWEGDLLSVLPSEKQDQERHNAALLLLDMAEKQILETERRLAGAL